MDMDGFDLPELRQPTTCLYLSKEGFLSFSLLFSLRSYILQDDFAEEGGFLYQFSLSLAENHLKILDQGSSYHINYNTGAQI
jgi:hypothetical protein